MGRLTYFGYLTTMLVMLKHGTEQGSLRCHTSCCDVVCILGARVCLTGESKDSIGESGCGACGRYGRKTDGDIWATGRKTLSGLASGNSVVLCSRRGGVLATLPVEGPAALEEFATTPCERGRRDSS